MSRGNEKSNKGGTKVKLRSCHVMASTVANDNSNKVSYKHQHDRQPEQRKRSFTAAKASKQTGDPGQQFPYLLRHANPAQGVDHLGHELGTGLIENIRVAHHKLPQLEQVLQRAALVQHLLLGIPEAAMTQVSLRCGTSGSR